MELTHDVWRCWFETQLPLCIGLSQWSCSIFSVGFPDCVCILKTRSNKGFVRSFLCLLVADFEAAPEEAKCPVGFVDKGVDMDAHVNIICTSQSKVMSMPLSNKLCRWL